MSFRQAVDTVVQQNHVQVDVAAVGMDKVVAADGESVAVAAHLPYSEFRIGNLATGGNGSGTSVNGVHAVGIHIVGQTAGTADT